MDNGHIDRYYAMMAIVDRSSKNGSPLPRVVVTERLSFLYGRVGVITEYRESVWMLCVKFTFSQMIPHEFKAGEEFENVQQIGWWFLPNQIKLLE